MKINYRPELNGLRAIAVGAVILYHARITILGHQPFKGGFIGVDIFFVISGYLITSIILKELITTGSFSFKHFYERRIRRILPALLFVMLVSLPLAWMYLLPTSFIDFSKSILYSLGFGSNFYFHYSGQQYGAESGLLKPFLHTWSLSVEEQFYILFPIVLLTIFKYFRKYLVHILILGLVISLGLADWTSRNYPSTSFYFLHTRMWELLAGSILAYFEINTGHRSKNKILNLILPGIGLILIGHSILFFNDGIFHPSFYTLSPIIGVCLIIWFSNKNEIITKILSTKLFVGIGLISYSLYLWHYTIFSFAEIISLSKLTLNKKALQIIIIIFLSIISFYFVEQPARNNKHKFQKIFKIILISLIIILFFSLFTIFNNGFEKRFPRFFTENLLKSLKIIRNKDKSSIYDLNKNFSLDSNKKNIFLVGDSHAMTLVQDLKKKYEKNYNFSTSIYQGCQLIINVARVNKKTLKKNENCTSKIQMKRLKFINRTNKSIIIIFGRLPLILEEERFYNSELNYHEGEMLDFIQNENISINSKKERQKNIKINYLKTIQELQKNNHQIILVYPMPEVGIHVPNTLIKNFRQKKYSQIFKKSEYLSISYDNYIKRTKSSFEILDSLNGVNIYRVYPHKLFCNSITKSRCVTHDNKNIFYADDDHPSSKGAEMINGLIIKKINEIESNKK